MINRDYVLVSLDIKFIWQDQKQRINGKACEASSACFGSSLMNLISKNTYMVFCLSGIIR